VKDDEMTEVKILYEPVLYILNGHKQLHVFMSASHSVRPNFNQIE